MMTSRSLICLLENQNGGKLQKMPYKRDFIQYFFYFATFSMKKNNLKFKTIKVEGFHPRLRLRSAATPQYPSKLKN
jgi:hypothetical protein